MRLNLLDRVSLRVVLLWTAVFILETLWVSSCTLSLLPSGKSWYAFLPVKAYIICLWMESSVFHLYSQDFKHSRNLDMLHRRNKSLGNLCIIEHSTWTVKRSRGATILLNIHSIIAEFQMLWISIQVHASGVNRITRRPRHLSITGPMNQRLIKALYALTALPLRLPWAALSPPLLPSLGLPEDGRLQSFVT